MKCSLKDLPIQSEDPRKVSRSTEWGGMVVFARETHQTIDHTPTLTGSPEERCQCRHWGYVLKGEIRFDIAGQEEAYNDGDLFFVPPGHTVLSEAAGTQYIILMLADEWGQEVARKESLGK